MNKYYRITEDNNFYFLTLSIIDKLHVFANQKSRMELIDSLRFAQQKKDLQVAAWVLMVNHLHLITKRGAGPKLSDIMRDFKRHTSRLIFKRLEVKDRPDPHLQIFRNAARDSIRHTNMKIWDSGLHAKRITSSKFGSQKLEYIHQNPVSAKLVESAEAYPWSSAIDYAGGVGLLEITFPDWLAEPVYF